MTALQLALPALAADGDNETSIKLISPIIAEEVLPQDPKEFELRLGTDYRERNSLANGALPYAEANFGIIERLGGSLNVPMQYHNDQADEAYGTGDISISLKYVAVPLTRSVPAVVVALQAQFPSGDRHLGLGSGAYELTPFVGLFKDFGPLVVQGDIGWSGQVTGHRQSTWVYNWAAAIPVYSDRLYLLTEINGDWGSPNHSAIAPGLRYFFSDKL